VAHFRGKEGGSQRASVRGASLTEAFTPTILRRSKRSNNGCSFGMPSSTILLLPLLFWSPRAQLAEKWLFLQEEVQTMQI
jgi:hypothetical protein